MTDSIELRVPFGQGESLRSHIFRRGTHEQVAFWTGEPCDPRKSDGIMLTQTHLVAGDRLHTERFTRGCLARFGNVPDHGNSHGIPTRHCRDSRPRPCRPSYAIQ